jgi:hypothetical protein
MATIYEIVQGLSQAAANGYDGALDENGEPVKIGLKREDGDPILDQRVMEGFGVKFAGNMRCLTYQSDVQLKEVYASGFESDTEQRMMDISKWLKGEYKRITGNTVTLTKEGEIDVMVQNSSRVRSFVNARLNFRVGGLDEEMNNETGSKPQAEDRWRDFVSQGGWTGDGGKRPENDTRKKES